MPSDGGPIEHQILRCPNCRADVDPALTCRSCGARLGWDGAVYDLLPRDLDPVKLNEDRVYVEGGTELAAVQSRPWRRILARHQVLQVIRFDHEIVDLFPRGRFLELGGGTCFGAAIYKSIHPACPVYATDVAPSTLRNAALPTAALFPYRPDVFAALDAENLPFKDGTFDAIFAMTMIHHLPHPERMLREAYRVLAPGGKFVAVDHCVPRHFRWLFAEASDTRAGEFGIQEDLISYPRWRRIVRAAGLPTSCLVPYTSTAYQPDPAIALAGRLVGRLPSLLQRYLLPVGMMIVFDKR